MKCLNYVHVFFQFAMHLLKNSTTRIKIFYFKEMIYIYHPIPYTQLCVAVRSCAQIVQWQQTTIRLTKNIFVPFSWIFFIVLRWLGRMVLVCPSLRVACFPKHTV
jgi:hypothetical protein